MARDNSYSQSWMGKRNSYSGIYNPQLTTDLNKLLNELSYSNDENTRWMGLFIHKLISEYDIDLSYDILRLINSNIRVYNNGEYIYTNSNLNYIKALCSSCLVADLLNNKKLESLGHSILRKTLSGTLTNDEEFYAYISALSLKTGELDQEKLKDVIDAYVKAYSLDKDKNVILDNVRKMLLLIDYDDLKFKKTILGAYYNTKDHIVYLNDTVNDNFTIFHEFGHVIDEFFNDRSRNGRSFESLYRRARSHARSNPKFKNVLKKLNSTMNIVYDDANKIFDSRMIRIHGSKENIHRAYLEVVRKFIQENSIEDLLDSFGIDDETTDIVLNHYYSNTLDMDRLVNTVYNAQKENYAEKMWRALPEGVVSDMISSVFKSVRINVDNSSYLLFSGHDNDYYNSFSDASMSELLANYNLIKVMGLDRELRLLRDLFGDVFVNTLDRIYNSNTTNIRRFRNFDSFFEEYERTSNNDTKYRR